MEIKEFTEEQFIKGDARSIPKEVGSLSDEIVKSLTSRMVKGDDEYLLKCLQGLQNTFNLSTEFIRYLLLSESLNDRGANRVMNSNYGKRQVKGSMSKFMRFLRRNKIKTRLGMRYYKRMAALNNSLRLFKVGRVMHNFKV